MSNLIPPLLSSSPPPLGVADDDDDFGDFTMADDHSYNCQFSVPPTPEDTPKKILTQTVDINSNSKTDRIKEKDYQDKRKSSTESDSSSDYETPNDIKNTPPNNLEEEDMPNVSKVPSDLVVEKQKVPDEIASQLDNVPSYIEKADDSPLEIDDIYREEPPEITDDCCDDDFGDFNEYNSIPVLENEISDDALENEIINDETIPTVFNNIDCINEEIKIELEEAPMILSNNDKNLSKLNNEILSEDTINECDTEITVKESIISQETCKLNSEDCDSGNLSIVDDQINDTPPQELNEDDDDFADFADFSTAPIVSKEVIDEFTDFVQPPQSIYETKIDDDTKIVDNTKIVGDDDDDFGDFEGAKTNFAAFTEETKQGDDEDNDDFDDFTTANVQTFSIDPRGVLEKAEKIILEMFATSEEIYDECNWCDFTSEDSVFKEMKDITDTNALSYQWSKSTSQRGLLKSLNIDTRNILYGAGRNTSMPKFAANLGLIPLEPVKSDKTMAQPLTPSTAAHSNLTSIPNSSEIPAAQFDWNESGLANPLDSVSNEETQKLPENDLKLDQEDTTPTTMEEEIQTIPTSQSYNPKTFDTESVNSLQFADLPNEEESTKPTEEAVFDDFTSFQSSQKLEEFSGWSNNMVPLRESYINNIDAKKIDDEPGWLKPTILTPVLQRKESEEKKGVDDSWLNSAILTPTVMTSDEIKVLPDWSNPTNQVTIKENKNDLRKDDEWLKPSSKIINKSNEITVKNDEDDFSDFQMSLPPRSSTLTVLPIKSQPVENGISDHSHMNILQPVQVFKPNESQSAAQIIWPDPGITDEELMRFEMYSKNNDDLKKPQQERKLSGNTGLMYVEKSVVVPANKVVLSSKEVLLPPNDKVVISKDLVLPILDSSPRKYAPLKSQRQDDDDDWSDFMSNQDPVKKIHNNERTSTPELSLSIPQLSHIQPPKLPIPVITPHGLMQTKIPSSMPTQPKIQLLHVNPPQDGYQPSIISQQFAMQISQNTYSGLLQNSNYQTTSIPANMKTPTHQVSTISSSELNGATKMNSSFDDNDEWSEFISSRPTAPISNGLNIWNRETNIWNIERSPNIVSNPVHYTAPMQPKQNNLPCLSTLPDLDFASPKNRTFNKK